MIHTVWIISEGSPGHVSQSVGLVNALKEKIPLAVQTIECRPRLSGVARSLVRAWMGKRGKPLPRWVFKKWLRVQPLPSLDAGPDLIISSGGKSVFAARSLAGLTGAPYVFLGERKPYRSEWFHTVFTPSALDPGVNDVGIEMIPTHMTREIAESAAASWQERPTGRLWAMVIGGPSASHRYSPSDWEALADGMNSLARREGIRWLLTTSRRTTEQVEAWLCTRIDHATLAAAVWWAEKPEKKMAAFLGAAEQVFVTQDSVTMVTEAVASGRSVVVLRPTTVEFSPTSFLPGYFDNLVQHGRIHPLPLKDLSDYEPAKIVFSPRSEAINGELAAVLMGRLAWSADLTSPKPRTPRFIP